MATTIKTGIFTAPTGGVNSIFSITGLALPTAGLKVGIFCWNNRNTLGQTEASHGFGMGYVIASGDRGGASCASQHNAGTAVSRSTRFDDAAIKVVNSNGNISGALDFRNWRPTGDGLDLIVDTSFGQACLISYLIIASDEAAFQATGVSTVGRNTVGDEHVGTVGFQPDCALFFAARSSGINTVTPWSAMSFGLAGGTQPQNYVMFGVSEFGQTNMNTWTHCRSGLCLTSTPPQFGIGWRAAVSGWSSSGFVLTHEAVNVTSLASRALCMKGLSFKVGDFTTLTATGQIQVTNLGFSPSGVLLASVFKAASATGTIDVNDERNIGFFNANSRTSVSIVDCDAQNTADIGTHIRDSGVMCGFASPGTITINSVIDTGSIDSDGFTLTQTDAAPSSSFVWYLAVGAPVVTTPFMNSFEFSVESLLNHQMTPTFTFAHELTVENKPALDIENLGQTTNNFTTDVAGQLNVLQAPAFDIGHLARFISSYTFDIEYDGEVVQVFQQYFEFSIASLLSVYSVNNLTIEHLIRIVQDPAFDIEHNLRTLSEVTYSIENLLRHSNQFTEDVENLLSTISSFIFSVELLLKFIQNSELTIEELIRHNIIHAFDVENLLRFNQNATYAIQYLQSLVNGPAISEAHQASVQNGPSFDVEQLRNFNQAMTMSVEQLLRFMAGFVQNMDWSGEQSFSFSESFILDIEYLRTFVAYGTLNINTLLSLIHVFDSSIEVLGRIEDKDSVSIEQLIRTSDSHTFVIANLLSLSEQATFDTNFVATAPGVAILNLEALLSYADSKSLSVEQLQKQAIETIFNLVNSTKVGQRGTFDIEYDGVILVIEATRIIVLSGKNKTWTLYE